MHSCCTEQCRRCRGQTGPRGASGPATQLAYSANSVMIPANANNSDFRFVLPVAFESTTNTAVDGLVVDGAINVVENGFTTSFRATRAGTLSNLAFGLYVVGDAFFPTNSRVSVSVYLANPPAANSTAPPTFVETLLRADYPLPSLVVINNAFLQAQDNVHTARVANGQYVMVAVYQTGDGDVGPFVASLRVGLLFS